MIFFESVMTLNVSEGIATITLNRPATLNALTTEDYDFLANKLREIDAIDEVLVTVWQAQGNWFCSGTDVKMPTTANIRVGDIGTLRQAYLSTVANTTTDCGHALYSHRKILVAALNGPVMGMAIFYPPYQTTSFQHTS